jgi:hypoxanthine-guanine phosphoribosyltransferase
LPDHSQPVRALVIDDTWTTGARAQSVAYALKTAVAKAVAIVVLGRHVNPDHPPSARLLAVAGNKIFDPGVCAAELD